MGVGERSDGLLFTGLEFIFAGSLFHTTTLPVADPTRALPTYQIFFNFTGVFQKILKMYRVGAKFVNGNYYFVTRLHSSRMRTTRLLTISQHVPHRGGSAQGCGSPRGVYTGSVCPGGVCPGVCVCVADPPFRTE